MIWTDMGYPTLAKLAAFFCSSKILQCNIYTTIQTFEVGKIF